jgi:hypothetical protein
VRFENLICLPYECPGFWRKPIVCDALNPDALAVEENPLDALIIAPKRSVTGNDLESLEIGESKPVEVQMRR